MGSRRRWSSGCGDRDAPDRDRGLRSRPRAVDRPQLGDRGRVRAGGDLRVDAPSRKPRRRADGGDRLCVVHQRPRPHRAGAVLHRRGPVRQPVRGRGDSPVSLVSVREAGVEARSLARRCRVRGGDGRLHPLHRLLGSRGDGLRRLPGQRPADNPGRVRDRDGRRRAGRGRSHAAPRHIRAPRRKVARLDSPAASGDHPGVRRGRGPDAVARDAAGARARRVAARSDRGRLLRDDDPVRPRALPVPRRAGPSADAARRGGGPARRLPRRAARTGRAARRAVPRPRRPITGARVLAARVGAVRRREGPPRRAPGSAAPGGRHPP